MRIRTRAEWGAAPPVWSRLAHQSPAGVRENFVHHSAGRGASVDRLHEQVAALQAMQAFHQQDRGWADIAYHFIVFQPYGRLRRARIFAGRPTNVVPAAQQGHNTNTIAVCIVQADPERLRPATFRAVGRLLRDQPGRRVRGHYEVFGTECPGRVITGWLDRIARAAGKRR